MTLEQRLTATLLNDVEALCRVYIGKNSDGEQWRDTLERIDILDKLLKRIRRAQAKEAA